MVPISFQLGPLNLTLSRVVFTLTLPFLLANLFTGRYGRILITDILIILYMLWRAFSLFITTPDRAFEAVASNTAIFLGAYMCARASVRTIQDFQFVCKMLTGFVILSLPFALYETTTGKMFIPRLLDALPGIRAPVDLNYPRRFGLDRVQFVFVHAIHYGLFCSSSFPFMYVALKDTISTTRRWISSLIIMVCCFTSVSSGAFLALLCQLPLIFYNHVLLRFPRRWSVFAWVAAILYMILEVSSNRPAFYAISSRIAFDSWTANYRKVLLDAGIEQIGYTPILGVGMRRMPTMPAWMNGSLDNFWLGDAVMFGMPALIFHFTAVVISIYLIGNRSFKPGGSMDNARFAWIFVILSLCLTLATVFIWSEIASLVFFIYGMGALLITGQDEDATAPIAPAVRASLQYTRFPKPTPNTASTPDESNGYGL